MKNMYKVLGVQERANAADIKAAYRRRSLETHPDRNGNDKVKEEEFKRVQEAYQVLGDASRRSQHDDALRAERDAAARREREMAQARAKQQTDAQRIVWMPPTSRGASGSDPGKAILVGAGIMLVGGILASLLGDRPGPGRPSGGSGRASSSTRARARWDPSAQRYRGSDGRFRPG